jgi:hypothetical protein
MNCCDYQCNQGRDCPARGKPATNLPFTAAFEKIFNETFKEPSPALTSDLLTSEKSEEQDSADQVAGLEAAGRLVVQIAVAVVFFAAGFAFALWAAKGHVL